MGSKALDYTVLQGTAVVPEQMRVPGCVENLNSSNVVILTNGSK